MTAPKPQFNLARVKDTETDDAPAIIPIATFPAAIIARRNFLCTGVSAAVALLFLNGCGHEPTHVTAPFSPLLAHNSGGGVILAINDSGDLNSIAPNGVLKTWSLHSGQLLQTSKGQAISSSTCRGATTPDGKLRVTLSGGGYNIEVRTVSDNELVATLTGHTTSISCLVIAPDGKQLISADQNGTIIIWNLDPPGFHSFLFDPAENGPEVKGIRYTAYDRKTGQSFTYTVPCNSTIPSDATCICNCVPGTYGVTPPPSIMSAPPIVSAPPEVPPSSIPVSTPTPAHTPRPPRRHRDDSYGYQSGTAPCGSAIPRGAICTCNCI